MSDTTDAFGPGTDAVAGEPQGDADFLETFRAMLPRNMEIAAAAFGFTAPQPEPDEPRWTLLNPGDVIREGDDIWRADGMAWDNADGIEIGVTVKLLMAPIRRPAPAPVDALGWLAARQMAEEWVKTFLGGVAGKDVYDGRLSATRSAEWQREVLADFYRNIPAPGVPDIIAAAARVLLESLGSRPDDEVAERWVAAFNAMQDKPTHWDAMRAALQSLAPKGN